MVFWFVAAKTRLRGWANPHRRLFTHPPHTLQNHDIPKKEEETKACFKRAIESVTVGGKRVKLHEVDWRSARGLAKSAMILEATAAAEGMLVRYLEELLRNAGKVHDRVNNPQLSPDLAPCVWTIVWAARDAGVTLPLDEEKNLMVVAEALVFRYNLPGGLEAPLHCVDADVRGFLSGNGQGRDPTDYNVTRRLLDLCDETKTPKPDETMMQRLGWTTEAPPAAPPGGGGGGGAPYMLPWQGVPGATLPTPGAPTIFTFPNGSVTVIPAAGPPPAGPTPAQQGGDSGSGV